MVLIWLINLFGMHSTQIENLIGKLNLDVLVTDFNQIIKSLKPNKLWNRIMKIPFFYIPASSTLKIIVCRYITSCCHKIMKFRRLSQNVSHTNGTTRRASSNGIGWKNTCISCQLWSLSFRIWNGVIFSGRKGNSIVCKPFNHWKKSFRFDIQVLNVMHTSFTIRWSQ